MKISLGILVENKKGKVILARGTLVRELSDAVKRRITIEMFGQWLVNKFSNKKHTQRLFNEFSNELTTGKKNG